MSAVVTRRDFTARTNADWHEVIRLATRASVDAPWVPVPLAGQVPRMTVADADGAAVLVLTVGDGLVWDDSTSEIAIDVPALRMQGLPPAVYAYDIQFRGSGIDVPIAGSLTVEAGVTRV